MAMSLMPFAVSGIRETAKIRVLIYANNKMAHAALSELLADVNAQISDMKNEIERLRQRLAQSGG